MSGFKDKLLEVIVSSAYTSTIVADEDGLFELSEVIELFDNQGFEIIRARNSFDVRIQFELQMREATNPKLLIAPSGYSALPDIREAIHFVRLELTDLFPRFFSSAIAGLNFEALEKLYEKRVYEDLGESKTIKHLMKNVFEVDDIDGVTSTEDFLSRLMDLMLGHIKPNSAVLDFAFEFVKRQLPGIDRSQLTEKGILTYLQNRWETYLLGEDKLDFESSSLAKNVSYLFATGKLSPVNVDEATFRSQARKIPLGVFLDKNRDSHFEGLLAFLEESSNELTTSEHFYSVIEIATAAKLLSFEIENIELIERYETNIELINAKFQDFIDAKYGGLFSLSGVKHPNIVSKILEHIKFSNTEKRALVVVDGMNYWQWDLISKSLNEKGIEHDSRVSFAYLPSITAWSRQAIFRGDKPDLSADNSREGKLFREYWINQGYVDSQIGFEKIDLTDKSRKLEITESTKILGVVTNDLDELMHGAHMGDVQLLQNTKLWIEKGGFMQLIELLKDRGFEIFVTTDHGSVEATGIKNLRLIDRVGSKSRSKRHIHFSNRTMLQNFAEQNPEVDFGVKDDSVYLRGREAFTTETTTVVTHGGSHFWEVLIPFVRI